MTTPAENWKQRRKAVRDRIPEMTIKESVLKALEGQKAYEIVIRGENLQPSIRPPQVTVGGDAVTDLVFSKNGTEVRGKLRQKPSNRDMVVDLGFVTGKSRLDEIVEPPPSIIDLLARIWQFILRLFK